MVAQLRLRLDECGGHSSARRQQGRSAVLTLRPDIGLRDRKIEVAFHDASQFHWNARSVGIGPAGAFRESTAVVLPRWRVQDIDAQDDWRRAELMLAAVAV